MAYKWLEEDLQYIKDNGSIGATDLHKLLPHIPVPTIRYKLKTLGINTKAYYWSEQDTKFLINNKDKYTLEELATKLNRSVSAIQVKLTRLSDSLVDKRRTWSEEELEAMICFSGEHTIKELTELFPGKSKESISHFLRKHNLSYKPGKLGGCMQEGKPTTLYLVNFGKFFKLGITQQTLTKRLKAYPQYTIEWEISDITLEKAKELRSDILKDMELFTPDNWINNNIECFYSEEVPIKPIV